MPRTIYLLLLSLLVYITACKKESEEAKPAPTLEGRWEYKNSLDYTYDATGKEISRVPWLAPEPYYMDLTATTLQYVEKKTNKAGGLNQIKVEGDMLYFLPTPGHKARIKNLTENTLTLSFEGPFGDPKLGYTQALEDHYVR
ncbi:hypothetical protein E5K00_18495 [Hymenobacter aquaticus]|uniref:Lipocalin-like domain-containing protein n=1 Tax=Hymenobacter aquaticus TaxID=1867101 RepID=A0A4Z0PWS9_9BACT|nr:hypothetical protein [Hymenobacter aquaticus]TGE22238.1 hypothetical protein E5K00_18495 [Hymenobacter aquaticus]